MFLRWLTNRILLVGSYSPFANEESALRLVASRIAIEPEQSV